MAKKTKSRKLDQNRKMPWFKVCVTGVVVVAAILVYLDAHLVKAITGHMWSQPAVIYARPLEIYEGAPLTKAQLRYELKALGYQPVNRVSRAGQFSVADEVEIYVRGFEFEDGIQPAEKIRFSLYGGVLQSLQASSPILRVEPIEIGRISPALAEDRLLVALDEVPKPLQAMLIASEDRAFYEHAGISLKGISRAFYSNIKSGRVSQGGSTLTQQLVKNYFLSAERTVSRKLREILLSVLLELHLSKDKILESYINEIFLAQNGDRAVHGFGLAAHYFFDKPISELALPEQALLVSLVRGPSFYNPYRNPERAKERRNLILKLYAEQSGQVSPSQLAQLSQASLGVVEPGERSSQRMPAYLDVVKRELRQYYSNDDLSRGGLRVFTHFDPWAQRKTEQAVVSTLNRLNDKQLQAAAVVAKPETGHIIALVGDRNPRYPGFNRVIDAKRHVGSLLKPAVYLTALQQPNRYHLTTALIDAPLKWQQPDGSVWEPQNYDGESHGRVPLYKALAMSYNQAAASLGRELGMVPISTTLEKMGMALNEPLYPSALLGATDLSPLAVTQLYQVIAGGGFYAQLNTVRTVTNASGDILTYNPLLFEQRFDSHSMALLQFALNRVTIEGSGRWLGGQFPSTAIAGKTGTSDQLRDSWFAGFSSDYLGVVWLGHDDNTPTSLTGASGALRVWGAAMKPLIKHSVSMPVSDEVLFLGYNPVTEMHYQAGCEAPLMIPYMADYAPSQDISCRQPMNLQNFKQRVLNWFLR